MFVSIFVGLFKANFQNFLLKIENFSIFFGRSIDCFQLFFKGLFSLVNEF
jgi:hypothetical protein